MERRSTLPAFVSGTMDGFVRDAAARLPLAPVGNGYQSDYAVNGSSAADPASDAHNGTVLARVAQGD